MLLGAPALVGILMIYVFLGHKMEKWKRDQPHIFSIFSVHESVPAIILGIIAGFFTNIDSDNIQFDGTLFFYVVLPPIIFYQGYNLKKRNFFRFFHYILAYGVIGTLIQFSFMTILIFILSGTNSLGIVEDDGSLVKLSVYECMLMAAVLCAADEIATITLIKTKDHPKLSAILFGEGVLNDGISILLFHVITQHASSSSSTTETTDDSTMNNSTLLNSTSILQLSSSSSDDDDDSPSLPLPTLFFTSIYVLIMAVLVGVGVGLATSFILKHTPSFLPHPTKQTIMVMLGGYLSFMTCEALGLSGVLSVFFCGITLSHYAWYSLSPKAQISTKITFDTLATIAEAYCFAAVGYSLHSISTSRAWSMEFCGIILFVLFFGRGVTIFAVSFFGWLVSPTSFTLPHGEQIVLSLGGMVRGAISWSQILLVTGNHRMLLITTVLSVVIATVVFFGVFMSLILKCAGISRPDSIQYIPLRGNVEEKESLIKSNSSSSSSSSSKKKKSKSHFGPTDDDIVYADENNNSGEESDEEDLDDDSMRRRRNADLEENEPMLRKRWHEIDERFMKPIFGGKVVSPSSSSSHSFKSDNDTYQNTGTIETISQSSYHSVDRNQSSQNSSSKKEDENNSNKKFIANV